MTKIDKSSKQSIDNRSYELSDFIIQNQIGEGGFGKVYIVKLKESGEIFAAKILTNKIEDSANQILHDISREVNIISKLDHQSVLKFIFYSFYNFKNKPKPVIITEYAPNGTLGDLIKTEMISHTNIYWDDTHKLIIIYGVAAAMSYLHSHNIIHRDLKPDNIFIIIKKDAFDRINIFENPSLKYEIFPLREFNKYDEEYKKLINDAEQDAENQFIVECSFIEGRDLFPLRTEYGLKYIKKSYKNSCIESLKYYIKMLIKGKLIPRNIDKASKLIEDYFKNDPGEYSLFIGLIISKEGKFNEAFKCYRESAQKDSSEGLYKFANFLYVCANDDDNKQKEDALKFLHMAGDKGCVKAYRTYGLYLINYNSDIREEGKKYLKLAADKDDAVASYYYSAILYNDENQDDLLESANYMKMAANAGNVDAMREYIKRYPYNKDDLESVNNYVRFCKKACDKGDFYSMYLYRLLLKKSEVVKNDYRLAIRFFEIACNNGIEEAKIEIGIEVWA